MDENAIAERRHVRRAYARCRRMQRRHDPTFALATSCLPADRRPAVHALYGFLRGADDIVDDPARIDRPQERRAALDAWQHELETGLERGTSRHPVLAALVDAGRRHDLGLERLSVYMDSMRVDCAPVRIRCVDDLDRYMDGSAATVGRIMAPLLGLPAADQEAVAQLGVAFQLTNFVRDVPEDWGLDRIYLPGVPEADLADGTPSDAFREGIAAEVDRARRTFAETAGIESAIHPSLRRGVRLARAVYLRVLDRVERLDHDVLRGRASLPPWEMAAAGARGLRALPRGA